MDRARTIFDEIHPTEIFGDGGKLKFGAQFDYDQHKNGQRVIAVGGNRLSRGLTLEGLSSTYFVRESRMYDTLTQMGRWFGFRPGYADLVRLHITPNPSENGLLG